MNPNPSSEYPSHLHGRLFQHRRHQRNGMPGDSPGGGLDRAAVCQQWYPTIDREKCIGCGECLNTCPNGVFVLDEETMKAEVAVPDQCVVLCDKCAGFCSAGAISFPDKEQTKQRIALLLKNQGRMQRK